MGSSAPRLPTDTKLRDPLDDEQQGAEINVSNGAGIDFSATASSAPVDIPPPQIPTGIDPEVRRQAMERAALAHAIHGMADRTVVTPYDVRQGLRPQVQRSPVAEAAQEMALAPLHEEEARAATSAKTADIMNKYSMAKAGLQSKQSLAELMRAAAALNPAARVQSAGMAADSRVKAAEAQADRMRTMLRLRHEMKVGDKMTEEGGFGGKDAPDRATSAFRENAKMGVEALDRLAASLQGNPDLLGTSGMSKTWGNIRISAGPDAQQLAIDRDLAHEALLQAANRQGTKMGGSLARAVLPFAGDDAAVSLNGITAARRMLAGEVSDIESSKPKYDWEAKGPRAGFSQTPYADQYGSGKKPRAAAPPPKNTPDELARRAREKLKANPNDQAALRVLKALGEEP